MTDDKFLEILMEQSGNSTNALEPIQCSRNAVNRLRRIAKSVGIGMFKHPTEEKFCIPVSYYGRIYVVLNKALRGDSFVTKVYRGI